MASAPKTRKRPASGQRGKPTRKRSGKASRPQSGPAGYAFTTWLYLIIVALTAACGLVVEIVAGRMIAPYLGMSLYTWTAIIAVVLAGFSVGHWIGGRIADLPGARARYAVAACLLLAGLSAAASLVLIRVLSGPVIALDLPAVPTILIITTALFFLPSLFVGIPSPVLTKLAIEASEVAMGRVLGAFYAAGAIGSIAGTLAAGFIFISWLGTIRTILLVTSLYVALGVILFLARPHREKSGKRPHVPAATAAGLLLLAGGALAVAGSQTLAFTPNCDTESRYYCIRVIDLSAQMGEPARVMVLDHLGHGINLAGSPSVLVTPYVEAQDQLARIHTGGRSSFRAFLIGGGAYTLPRAWLATWSGPAITIAEIDPEVTRVARESLWLPDDDRLTIRHADARRVLAADKTTYDVIVGDAFHDIAVPQHLVTLEFFRLVRARLDKDGIYLMNVVDSYTHPRLALSIAATLRAVFPVVELWQSNESGERATFVVAAAGKPTPQETLSSRVQPGLVWRRLGSQTRDRLAARLQPFVLTDDFAPVDRLIGVE